jgi:hypothetical protein
MAAETPAAVRPLRRPWWRVVTQFSLRTLLLLVTAASVGCWWFLQPKTREEPYLGTPLRLQRQVRLIKFDSQPPKPSPPPGHEVELINGQYYETINAGRWRLQDQRGNLLVDGRYENGQQHGRWITYHTNGRKAADGRMERGAKVGRWRTWDEEGALVSEVMYSEGMK